MPEQRLELKRHYLSLTTEETDEVVGLIADLIVRFLQAEKTEPKSPGEGNESPKPAEQTAASAGR